MTDISSWPWPVPPDEVAVRITYKGEPVAKERPRFWKGRAVTPAKTVKFEAALQNLFYAELFGRFDGSSLFELRCIFYRGSHRRIDVDNCAKAVSDAANKQVWKDDWQVAEVHAKIVYGDPDPRVEVLIRRLPPLSPLDALTAPE